MVKIFAIVKVLLSTMYSNFSLIEMTTCDGILISLLFRSFGDSYVELLRFILRYKMKICTQRNYNNW